MRNRVAWGVAVLLALLLLGGVGVLGVSYTNRLPGWDSRLTFLSREDWGFGRSTLHMSWGIGGPTRHWIVLGCFGWRVEQPPPSR